ncbi:MAG TPA: class I SAM-dependent methyltransferase [Caulobacteraceae bacterium]|jgi:SAM-dependent methyltransferase|nr:class I SAM-dependent methyltransferase [Caulobacteraceae bacterium]
MTSQAMRPHGAVGRVFGLLMTLINAPAFAYAEQWLAPRSEDAILEIGFGTGRLVRRLAVRARFVGGVDPSPLMLGTALKANAAAVAGGKVELRLGEAGAQPWADATFDAACALHSFQFWPDPAAGLTEVARVLKPDGRLLLMLRAHPRPGTEPLPNLLSRSSGERAETLALLNSLGWRDAEAGEPLGRTATLTARRPARL